MEAMKRIAPHRSHGPAELASPSNLISFSVDEPRASHRRAAEQRDELASPHIGSQAQESALYPLKQVL